MAPAYVHSLSDDGPSGSGLERGCGGANEIDKVEERPQKKHLFLQPPLSLFFWHSSQCIIARARNTPGECTLITNANPSPRLEPRAFCFVPPSRSWIGLFGSVDRRHPTSETSTLLQGLRCGVDQTEQAQEQRVRAPCCTSPTGHRVVVGLHGDATPPSAVPRGLGVPTPLTLTPRQRGFPCKHGLHLRDCNPPQSQSLAAGAATLPNAVCHERCACEKRGACCMGWMTWSASAPFALGCTSHTHTHHTPVSFVYPAPPPAHARQCYRDFHVLRVGSSIGITGGRCRTENLNPGPHRSPPHCPYDRRTVNCRHSRPRPPQVSLACGAATVAAPLRSMNPSVVLWCGAVQCRAVLCSVVLCVFETVGGSAFTVACESDDRAALAPLQKLHPSGHE